MKNFLKQLLCCHEYAGQSIINFSGYHITISECKHCGKVHVTATKIEHSKL